MIIRSVASLLAALSLAGAAQAADHASPQEVAHAKAEADALIRSAHVGDLFVNVTDSNIPTVRHLRSGLECSFEPGARNEISVFEKPFPRGEDVACGTHAIDFTETLYATHLPAGTTLDQAVQMVMADIRNVHPHMDNYRGTVANMSRDPKPGEKPLPETKTGRFVITEGNRQLFSYLSVSMVNGWLVEERVTGPLDKAMAGDLLGGMNTVTVIQKMVDHPLQ